MIKYLYRAPENSLSSKILMVFHGLGAQYSSLVESVSFAKEYHRYFFQAPIRKMALFNNQSCSSWYTWEKNFSISAKNIAEMKELLIEVGLVLERDGHSDLSQLHAVGFSQGGVIALTAAQCWELKSVALLSTFYDKAWIPALKISKTNIFVSMSDSDAIVDWRLSARMSRELSPEAFSLEICEDPSMGHSISVQVEREYRHFLEKIDKA